MTTWHSTSDLARELPSRPRRTHCAPRPQHLAINGVDSWHANEGASAARPTPNCAAIVAPQRRYVYIDSSWLRARQRLVLVELPGNLPRQRVRTIGADLRDRMVNRRRDSRSVHTALQLSWLSTAGPVRRRSHGRASKGALTERPRTRHPGLG